MSRAYMEPQSYAVRFTVFVPFDSPLWKE